MQSYQKGNLCQGINFQDFQFVEMFSEDVSVYSVEEFICQGGLDSSYILELFKENLVYP